MSDYHSAAAQKLKVLSTLQASMCCNRLVFSTMGAKTISICGNPGKKLYFHHITAFEAL